MTATGFYFFILSTPGRDLILGVTKDLPRCLCDLRGPVRGSATPLTGTRLVYFEIVLDLPRAFARKAQLEGWNRRKKWRLISGMNPEGADLSGLLRARS